MADESAKVDVIRVSRDENPISEVRREWLLTNGLGGFASATISGEITRRYHGFLIAALPAPLGRMVILNDLEVAVVGADGSTALLHEAGRFIDFTLTLGLPSWRYEIDGVTIEKSVVMPAQYNITHIAFRLIDSKGPVRLQLRPLINFRGIEVPVSEPLASGYALTAHGNQYEITAGPDLPVLRLAMTGCDAMAFTADGGSRREYLAATEEQRGYDARGSVWNPGYFTAELEPDCVVTLIAATEGWHTILALHPDQARRFETERRRRLVAMAMPPARQGLAAELVLDADTFVITPVGRVADIVRAHAEGDEMRTVIAGYHWFTDWGRDTMISLEGLTLSTGCWRVPALRVCPRRADPEMFPEGDNQGLYHTADATLWFFHALSRYVERTSDRATLSLILPLLQDIVRHHLEGTRFGIKVDPRDGLLTQGAEGYQLTWMDAKVGDWVVTPRRGKAVEINALWYNALCLLAEWLRDAGSPGGRYAGHAGSPAILQPAFLAWAGRLSLRYRRRAAATHHRPNQIFAISLTHPVLDPGAGRKSSRG
jgi:predicted glycogen debranching enzyme